MRIEKGGKGIGSDKHEKLHKYIAHWQLKPEDLVVEHFEAREYNQVLTYVYRNGLNGQYYLLSSSVGYNEYLAYLDWKKGLVELEEGETEVSYEHEVVTFHLPLDALRIMAGDAIDWLQTRVEDLQRQQHIDDESFDFRERERY